MLRQVAYDTLSRRDRKARHLAVAAHLRAAFAGDGEEVTDVIAPALPAAPRPPPGVRCAGGVTSLRRGSSKLSGMHWTIAGASAISTLRCQQASRPEDPIWPPARNQISAA
jgi:hypothetical protein